MKYTAVLSLILGLAIGTAFASYDSYSAYKRDSQSLDKYQRAYSTWFAKCTSEGKDEKYCAYIAHSNSKHFLGEK